MFTLFSKAILSLGAVAAFSAATLPAIAQAGEVHNRIERQQARIDQGVRSGQLTRGEYVRDDNRLDRVQAQRRRDLRDGRLSPAKKTQLNRELNRSSDQIYFTKHNRADQPGV